MKYLSLVLFAVFCTSASAETLIGEFSGTLDTTFVLGNKLELLEELGASHGDIIYGSFQYDSDGPEIPIEDVKFNAGFRGARFFEADWLQINFGDVLLENNEVNVMTATYGADFPTFGIIRDAPAFEGANVSFEMFPNDSLESPIFSNELPQSTEDFNAAAPFTLYITILNIGYAVELSDQSFTLEAVSEPSEQYH